MRLLALASIVGRPFAARAAATAGGRRASYLCVVCVRVYVSVCHPLLAGLLLHVLLKQQGGGDHTQLKHDQQHSECKEQPT